MESPTDPKVCPLCGQSLNRAEPAEPAPPKSKWFHNPWVVLFMISPIALGPFGLGLLWKSPKFSRQVKLWLTIFTLAWTLWACWYVVFVFIPAITKEVDQFQSTLSF